MTLPSPRALIALSTIASMGLTTPGCAAADPGPTSGRPFLLGGIQVNEPDHDRWIRGLQDARMNTVAVTVYGHQGDWDTDHLWFDEDAEWVVREIRAAKQAGLHVVLILRVALDHAFERNRFLWHGMIMPRTPALLRSWFAAYERFALKWARIAQAEGVDVLGVSSELNALTSTVPVDSIPALERYYLDDEQRRGYEETVMGLSDQIDTRHLRGSWNETYDSLPRYMTDRASAERAWAQVMTFGGNVRQINARRMLMKNLWADLIAAVRETYSGALTYAANFDQYEAVAFWAELDLIGINAYFPLRSEVTDTRDPGTLYPILEESWRSILKGVDDLRRRQGVTDRPVLLTELGYTFRTNSTIQPWAADGFALLGADEGRRLMIWDERDIDYQERALAVRALREAAAQVDSEGDGSSEGRLLAGILYWKIGRAHV